MFNIWLLFYVLLSGVFDSVTIIGRCKALYNCMALLVLYGFMRRCMACNAIIQAITTKQATVTVLSTPIDESVTIYVQPLDEICFDFPETLSYYAMRGGVRDDSIPVSFKIENINVTNNYNTYLKKITITDNGNHTIELAVNGSVMMGKKFDLVAYNDEYEVENRQNIKVVSLF